MSLAGRAALLLLLISPLAVAQQEDSESPQVAPAAEAAEEDPEQEALLRRLSQGNEEVLTLTMAAMEVARAEAWDELERLLQEGSVTTQVAVLSALRTLERTELLDAVIELGARGTSAEVRQRATEHLKALAVDSTDVFDVLLGGFTAGQYTASQAELLITVLGASRHLAAVDPLLAELDGSRAALARRALIELTGRRAPADIDTPEGWRTWWEQARWKTREELLEDALAEERRRHAHRLRERDDVIVQLELRHMGQDVTRLISSLESEFASVRLEAAQRLGTHANVEQAASAVPVLLRRLGHAVAVSDGSLSESPSEGEREGREPLEEDADVRRAEVVALGALGRDRPEVLDALVLELQSEDLGTAREAVEALSRVRSSPSVVEPLLDLLESRQLGVDSQITALSVIAHNEPQGVAERLAPWTTKEFPPSVRAAGVRALLTGASPSEALGLVDGLVGGEPSPDVRYAAATGLGEQLRGLEREDPNAPVMVSVLGRMLADLDPSVRAEAAASLGDGGELSALALLEEHSRVEADVNVMVRVLDAFGNLGVIDSVDTIGRICSRWTGAGREDLEQAARRALQRIGDERRAEDWLGMARSVQEVGCFPLAAWCLREGLHRFESDPSEREVVAQVRGELANVLWQSGEAEEAHQLLVELHEAGAPYPIASTRLDLLARTSEQLGYFDQAAGFYAARLDLLGEGDSTLDDNERGLARTLLLAGRAAEALPRIEALLSADGADNGLLEDLARAQVALALVEEARSTYARLLERLPADDEVTRERVEDALAALPSVQEEGPEVVPLDGVPEDERSAG